MIKFRKNLRLKDYNYCSNGAYFVTLCTNLKRDLIGEEERRILEYQLAHLEEHFPGVKVDYYVVMKNHLHAIFLFHNSQTSLPKVVQVFKSITTLIFKKGGYRGKTFWQRNYYEHVIRNEKALEKIKLYLQNNPLAEKLESEEIYKELPIVG